MATESYKKLLQKDIENPDYQRHLYGIKELTPGALKVLFLQGDTRGSGWYRGIQSAICINEHFNARINQVQSRFISQWDLEPELHNFPVWDLFVWQRQHNPKVLKFITDLRLKFPKSKHVFEVDDDLLHIDKSSPAYAMTGTLEYQKMLHDFIRGTDCMISSTKYLADMYNREVKGCPPVIVVPNGIFFEIIDHIPPEEPRTNDNIVIGYMGTGTHYIDLKPIIPVIKDILKKYPKTMFQIQGCIDYPFLTDDPDFKSGGLLHDRIKLIEFTDNMVNYFAYIRDVDIGICPLADIEFNKSKSNLKYLQFAAMGKPVLCSNVQPYTETYTAGGPMRLVEDIKGWEKSLSLFIENEKLRTSIGVVGKKFVVKKYDQRIISGQWADAYEKIYRGEI